MNWQWQARPSSSSRSSSRSGDGFRVVVDRRFNRSRYDAQAAVAAFTERLRDEVDLEVLQGSLLAIVEATLEPTASRLWLRRGGPQP